MGQLAILGPRCPRQARGDVALSTDLEGIADGVAASAAFLQLASGYLTVPEEADRLRAALLAYCRRDTLAMVEVHQALGRRAPRFCTGSVR